MVALRIAFTPPIEAHYAEQLLTTALETRRTSLSDAMTIAACERFEGATVATIGRAQRRAVDVERARARRRPGGERRRRGDGTINRVAARTPRRTGGVRAGRGVDNGGAEAEAARTRPAQAPPRSWPCAAGPRSKFEGRPRLVGTSPAASAGRQERDGRRPRRRPRCPPPSGGPSSIHQSQFIQIVPENARKNWHCAQVTGVAWIPSWLR